ncbi:hypothetical protein M426DRAFT_6802 [Hypoxylon sp. CI-4A]|nr:hypothetical protein M426DRAFT_6802 [Hypoxylon sp. CI-4A]
MASSATTIPDFYPSFFSGVNETDTSPNIPCRLDPDIDIFQIHGSNFIPLDLRDDDKLQPLQQVASEEEAIAMGILEVDYKFPTFFFQKPEDAPEGVYDIVLSSPTPRYIAQTSQGKVILTDSSTGTTPVMRNGEAMVTSIFNVDCMGRITTTKNGFQYTWDVSEDGSRIVFDANQSSTGRTMIALKKSQEETNIEPNDSANDNPSTKGAQPRCALLPSGLKARVFPGARDVLVNGCAMGEFDPVPAPNFYFKECCNAHDRCYGDCEHGVFEECNKKVRKCMHKACQFLRHWNKIIRYWICIGISQDMVHTYKGQKGRRIFSEYNDARCGCYCPNEDNLCGRTDHGHSCFSPFGHDTANCGACDRHCPSKAKCVDGVCLCPSNRCGERCVDLDFHPNNCGECGNKCPSGYCEMGECQELPADRCVAAQGFRNSDFAEHGEGWQGCTTTCEGAHTNVNFRGYQITAEMRGGGTADFTTTVTMCPDIRYDISWIMGRLAGVDKCRFKYKFGGKPESGWHDLTSNLNAMQEMGPFLVHTFAPGDPGTTEKGLSLDVTFQGTLSCEGDGFMMVLFDDFELSPALLE